MTVESLNTVLGLAGAAFGGLVALFRILAPLWAWHRRISADLELAKLKAQAPAVSRPELEAIKLEPPPDISRIATLAIAGGAALALAGALQAEVLVSRSGPVRRSCKGHWDCPPGQSCERGQCVATARRPPISQDDSWDGLICADRVLPRWQDRLPEVFAGQPPSIETMTPWLR